MTTSTMNTTNTTNNPKGSCASNTCAVTTPGTTMDCSQITEPGAYVCNWSGHLLRVNANCFSNNDCCNFSIEGNSPLTVTYLCDDADCTIEEARCCATNFGVKCNF